MASEVEVKITYYPLGANTELYKLNFIDLKDLVAQRSSRQIWGGGAIIKSNSKEPSDNLKRFINILEKNRFTKNILPASEINLSKSGTSIIYILPNPTNSPDKEFRVMLLSDPTSMGEISSSQNTSTNWVQRDNFNNVTYARTFNTINYGLLNIFVMQEWTYQGVKTIVNNSNVLDLKTGTKKDMGNDINELNEQLPTSMRIQEYWDYSDLGFIPMFVFDNYETVGKPSKGDLSEVPYLEREYNETMIAKIKETRASQTQVIGGNNAATNAVNYGSGDFAHNSSQTRGTSGNQEYLKDYEIIKGDPKLMVYEQALEKIIDKAFFAAGLSPQYNQHTQTTVVGTEYSKSGDLESSTRKRKFRKSQIDLMLERTLLIDTFINGKSYNEEDKVTIDIKSNLITDMKTKIDLLNAAKNLGIFIPDKAISWIYNVDEQEDIESIKEELKDVEQEPSKEEKTMDGGEEQDINNEDKTKN